MNKSINVRSEEFKSNLYSLINNSGLPISNVYFIFQLVAQELENTYYGTLNTELEEKNDDPNVNQNEMPEEITSKEGIENEAE